MSGDSNSSDGGADVPPNVAVERIDAAVNSDDDAIPDDHLVVAVEVLATHLGGDPRRTEVLVREHELVQKFGALFDANASDPAVTGAVADALGTVAEVAPELLAGHHDAVASLTTGSAPTAARRAGYRALAASLDAAEASPPEPAVERGVADLAAGALVPAVLEWFGVAARQDPAPFVDPDVVDAVRSVLPAEDPAVAGNALATLRGVADADPSLLFAADGPTPVVETVRALVESGSTTDDAGSAAFETGSRLLKRLAGVNAAPFADNDVLDAVVDVATTERVPDPAQARLLSVARYVADEHPGVVIPYRDAVLDLYERGGDDVKIEGAWVLSNLAATYAGRVAAAAPALESDLDHDAPNVRGNAAHALANVAIEDPLAVLEAGAVPGLVGLLADERDLAINALLALTRLVSATPGRFGEHVDRIVDLGNRETDPAVRLHYLTFARAAAPAHPEIGRDLHRLVDHQLREAPPAVLVASVPALAELAERDPEYLVPHAEALLELCRGDVSAATLGRLDEADRELEFDILNQLPSRHYDDLAEDRQFAGLMLLREVVAAAPAAMPTLDDRVLALVGHKDAELRAEAGRLLLETALAAPGRVDNSAARTAARTTDAAATHLVCLALGAQSSPWLRLRTGLWLRHADALDVAE